MAMALWPTARATRSFVPVTSTLPGRHVLQQWQRQQCWVVALRRSCGTSISLVILGKKTRNCHRLAPLASGAVVSATAARARRGNLVARGACSGSSFRHAASAPLATTEETAAAANPEAARRLSELRSLLQDLGVDALVVPTEDPHLSEYPPAHFARRAFLSGFSGSAGTVVVTQSSAKLWTDGRYFLQAAAELWGSEWEVMKSGLPKTPSVETWLAQELEEGQTVALDPSVHCAAFVLDLRRRLRRSGVKLHCLAENPVDRVWGCRPPMPAAPARQHPVSFAGRSASEKLAAVAVEMEKEGAEVLIVSALDEVAYLLNVRGGDVENTPFLLAFALLQKIGARPLETTLFVDEAKVPQELRRDLESSALAKLRPYEEVLKAVEALRGEASASGGSPRVWLDPKWTNYALFEAAFGAETDDDGAQNLPRHFAKPSPVAMMKAVKNEAELQGMRAAHRRDGAALALTLLRLEQRVQAGNDGSVTTEVDVDEEVTRCRSAQPGFLGRSFDTIAGYGPNAAIIHYRAQVPSAATLGTEALLLLDSGGQFADGTTDVTRTMHFGKPTREERECFTRVLQGHIALATAVFPEGTPGFVLDAFARRPLWQAGLDYRHGTGHGVGAALAVHEGPQKIAKQYDNLTGLKPGMIVSNEPGFYMDGKFGIRIENLLVVVVRDTPSRFDNVRYLGFEPLTLAPIQHELIDLEMLEEGEAAYLDAYHARVWTEVAPLLEAGSRGAPEEEMERRAVLAWLQEATASLHGEGQSYSKAAAAAARVAVGSGGSGEGEVE